MLGHCGEAVSQQRVQLVVEQLQARELGAEHAVQAVRVQQARHGPEAVLRREVREEEPHDEAHALDVPAGRMGGCIIRVKIIHGGGNKITAACSSDMRVSVCVLLCWCVCRHLSVRGEMRPAPLNAWQENAARLTDSGEVTCAAHPVSGSKAASALNTSDS